MEEFNLRFPFFGSRRVRDELDPLGNPVNRKRVQRLILQIGLRTL